MYWQEDDETAARPSSTVVDISLALRGKTCPIDYAWPLADAIHQLLPWSREQSEFGLHLAIAGEEGNGWYRDDSQGDLMFLSRRTRLIIRTREQNYAAIEALAGTVVDVSGHSLEIGKSKKISLAPITTLYARHVVTGTEDENAFLHQVAKELENLQVKCKKMLCGKVRQINTPSGPVATRSLMLADLSREGAIKLQAVGIGTQRNLGCGLFVPYKSITRLDAE